MLLLIIGVFVLLYRTFLCTFLQHFLLASTSNTSYWQSSAHNISSVYVGQSETYFTPKLASSLFPRLMQALCMFCLLAHHFYQSLKWQPGLYLPLFVSLLAIPVLGERIGRWRLEHYLWGMWQLLCLTL